jgi:methylated-DNA-protein-cysteine methyltransferase-like protein
MNDGHEYLRVYAAIAAIPPAASPATARLPRVPACRDAPAGRPAARRSARWHGAALVPRTALQRTDRDGARQPRLSRASRLLRAEGVEVKNGRVPLSRFGLDADLDHALWGMPNA